MVQDRLARQVVADGKHGHVVLLECFPLAVAVAGIGNRLGHFEVIARTGQFQPIEAKLSGLGRQCFKR